MIQLQRPVDVAQQAGSLVVAETSEVLVLFECLILLAGLGGRISPFGDHQARHVDCHRSITEGAGASSSVAMAQLNCNLSNPALSELGEVTSRLRV